MTAPQLVTAGAKEKAIIAEATARLKAHEAELTKFAPGQYTGENGETCTVCRGAAAGKPSFPPLEDDDEKINTARELAGDHFKKLVGRVISWKPVDQLSAVASVLLTPAKAAKFISLFEKAGKAAGNPTVRWT